MDVFKSDSFPSLASIFMFLLPLCIVIVIYRIKGIQQRIFSLVMKMTENIANRSLETSKKELFANLGEMSSQRKREGQKMKILEIGAGTGINFQYYPPGVELTCLDPNPYFAGYLDQLKGRFPNLNTGQFVVGVAEDMSAWSDATFDAVVCSLVMCSVTEPDKCMTEIHRVLKQGGKFFYIEHVIVPEKYWIRTTQKAIAWLWYYIFDGCHLLRDTATTISNTGFSSVQQKHLWAPYPFFAFPIAYSLQGIATK